MKSINTFLFITLIATTTLVSCSKKISFNSTNDANKKYSQQLEMNYSTDNTVLSASTDAKEIATSKVDTRFEPVLPHAKTVPIEIKKNTAPNQFIKVEKKNPLHKVMSKRIEKSFEKSSVSSEQVVTGRLRVGIILAAIGLLLIITAGFFGAAAPIIYVGGAVVFVIGIILILLAVL